MSDMKVRICYTTYVDDSCREKISKVKGELANRAQVKEYLEQFGLSSVQENEESKSYTSYEYNNNVYMDTNERKDLYPLTTKILRMWRKQ
tara:strand:+ start:498 stop:767 length:270 start_codon:yes stop_codon:yes gene_type:complete